MEAQVEVAMEATSGGGNGGGSGDASTRASRRARDSRGAAVEEEKQRTHMRQLLELSTLKAFLRVLL